jgi:WD40 repeat protein
MLIVAGLLSSGLFAGPSRSQETSPRLIVQTGHASSVDAAAVSADGKWLVTGGGDGTARLWEMASGLVVRVFRGHTDSVTSVALSPNGKWLATASHDRTVRLWDLAKGTEVRSFTGHTQTVRSVRFSPTSDWLVSAGGGGSGVKTANIRMWSLTGDKEVQVHSESVATIAISGEGKWLATGDLDDSVVRLRDMKTGEEKKVFKGHGRPIQSVAFSANGKYLVSGSADHTARLWDLDNGKEIQLFKGHAGSVNAVAIFGKWVVNRQRRQDRAALEHRHRRPGPNLPGPRRRGPRRRPERLRPHHLQFRSHGPALGTGQRQVRPHILRERPTPSVPCR